MLRRKNGKMRFYGVLTHFHCYLNYDKKAKIKQNIKYLGTTEEILKLRKEKIDIN